MTLTFDLLTLKVVSESRVTWATSVSILVFLGLSVHLGPMYATDVRQTDVRQKHRLMPPPIRGGDIIRRIVEKLRSQFAVLTGRTTAYDVTDGKVRYSATITVLE